MRRSIYLAAVLASAGVATTVAAADYSNTVFFGDSLTDAGTYASIVQLAYPDTGKFTTNPGSVWSENLAAALGTQATPAVNGGTNYAAGGARVTKNPGFPSTTGFIAAAPAIRDQVSAYLTSTGGRVAPNTLFSVWAGANDLFALEDAAANSVYLADPLPQVAGELATQIGRLKNAGAHQIIVFNLPDIGATPGSIADGPSAAALTTQHAEQYNRALFTQLNTQGISVIPIDTFNLLRIVVADPTRFGFSNATTPACDMTQVQSSLICNSSNYAPGSDQSHVFADKDHPSTATHRLLTEYVLGMLAAPQQITALPTNAIATRAALHDLLRTQLFAGALARERTGRHFWMAAQGQTIEHDSATLDPHADSSNYRFALGIDMPLSAQLTLGGALSFDHSTTDYAAGRGDFAQRDSTLSIYGRWSTQPWFVDGALSYGTLAYDIKRRVPLGLSALQAHGDTRGGNLSLQLESGYEFTSDAITHGPYLGLVAQELRINGFEEQGGETANLGYSSQRRHSLVGSTGWQLAYRAGSWSPYARLGVEHEFEDRDHDLTLRALSISEARAFDMPVTDPRHTRYPLQIGISGELLKFAGFNVGITHSVDQDHQNRTSFFGALSTRF